MRIYTYKILVLVLSLFFLYHSTIGYTIKFIKTEISHSLDREKIFFFKEKIKKEIRNSLKKDRILKEEEANLLREFINKLSKEFKN